MSLIQMLMKGPYTDIEIKETTDTHSTLTQSTGLSSQPGRWRLAEGQNSKHWEHSASPTSFPTLFYLQCMSFLLQLYSLTCPSLSLCPLISTCTCLYHLSLFLPLLCRCFSSVPFPPFYDSVSPTSILSSPPLCTESLLVLFYPQQALYGEELWL